MTMSQGSDQGRLIENKLSDSSVADTVQLFLDTARAKGVKVFAVIDQRAEAQSVGMDLRETTLVIFGNPKGGTPVMDAEPLAALDLPLKVLIWADGGNTTLSYESPASMASRLGLTPELAAPLAAIDQLTDAVVAAAAGDVPR